MRDHNGLDHAALDRYITGNWGEDQFKDDFPSDRDDCEDCGHAITLHRENGCEAELGDAPGDGEHCAMAKGPCGCRAYHFEEV